MLIKPAAFLNMGSILNQEVSTPVVLGHHELYLAAELRSIKTQAPSDGQLAKVFPLPNS
jgi:hypothetical protein